MKNVSAGILFGVLGVLMVVFLFPQLFVDASGLIRKTFGSEEEIVAAVPLDSEGETGEISYPKILISEVMAGTSRGAHDEFVELFNPNNEPAALTGWSMKKRGIEGRESTLVSSARFKDKVISPHRYLLIAHENGDATTSRSPDVVLPRSYSLNSGKSGLVLYNPKGERVDETGWTLIPKGMSFTRVSWGSSEFFLLSDPTPQNSSF